MAAWQFDVYFIPRGSAVPDKASAGWEPVLSPKVARSLQEDLVHYVGAPWFMLKDWLVFGPENGNRVDAAFNDDGSASVSVRLDIRNDAPQFLVLFTEQAKLHHCSLFFPEIGEVIEPDVHQVLSAITRWQSHSLGPH